MYGSLYQPLVLSYGLALIASLVTATPSPRPSRAAAAAPVARRGGRPPDVRVLAVSTGASSAGTTPRSAARCAARWPCWWRSPRSSSPVSPRYRSSRAHCCRSRSAICHPPRGAAEHVTQPRHRIAARVGEELPNGPDVHEAPAGRPAVRPIRSAIASSRLWVSLARAADRSPDGVRLRRGRRLSRAGATTVTYSQQRLDDVEDLDARGRRGAAGTVRRRHDGGPAQREGLHGDGRQGGRGTARDRGDPRRARDDRGAADGRTGDRGQDRPGRGGAVRVSRPATSRRDAALPVSGLAWAACSRSRRCSTSSSSALPTHDRSLSDIRNLPITSPRAAAFR